MLNAALSITCLVLTFTFFWLVNSTLEDIAKRLLDLEDEVFGPEDNQ